MLDLFYMSCMLRLIRKYNLQADSNDFYSSVEGVKGKPQGDGHRQHVAGDEAVERFADRRRYHMTRVGYGHSMKIFLALSPDYLEREVNLNDGFTYRLTDKGEFLASYFGFLERLLSTFPKGSSLVGAAVVAVVPNIHHIEHIVARVVNYL